MSPTICTFAEWRSQSSDDFRITVTDRTVHDRSRLKRRLHSIAARIVAVLLFMAASTDLLGDDTQETVAPQIQAARENALAWWRDSNNSLHMAQSIHTTPHGQQQRSLVFVLRDPQGRSLAVGYAGSEEMRLYFEQKGDELIKQYIRKHAPSDAQIAKLELAVVGDIARFNRRVQEAEQYLNGAQSNESIRLSKQYLRFLGEDCERGLFSNEQSLFYRVAATMFTAKQ